MGRNRRSWPTDTASSIGSRVPTCYRSISWIYFVISLLSNCLFVLDKIERKSHITRQLRVWGLAASETPRLSKESGDREWNPLTFMSPFEPGPLDILCSVSVLRSPYGYPVRSICITPYPWCTGVGSVAPCTRRSVPIPCQGGETMACKRERLSHMLAMFGTCIACAEKGSIDSSD